MQRQVPLTVGEPRDRQDVTTAHEQAVNELRDHGYPYARVCHRRRTTARTVRRPRLSSRPSRARLRISGRFEIAGNTSVSDRVIERQLTFKPGDLYRRSIVQDSQRRLYWMELFQFVNVESINPEQQRRTCTPA